MDAAVREAENNSVKGPWALPKGWCWVPLKSLSSFIGRGRGPTYVATGGVPVVNQKCIRWHRLETQYFKQTSREAFDCLAPELRIRAGDLLWNSTGTGTIGRAVLYDGSIPELTIDSHVTLVRPTCIESSYLEYFIETLRVQHLVTDGHVGSTNQQELPRSFVEDLLIPVPPAAEQRRIVARVDELFAEIAEGETALAEARKGLDAFRRALLKAAVTGELTKDWRAANPVSETAHDLLAQVAKERAINTSAKGRRGRNTEAVSLDASALPRLPDGWAWASLGEIVSEMEYGTSEKCDYTFKGIPVLRMGNVNFGSLDYSNLKYALPDSSPPILDDGDLIFNRTNSAELVGKSAVYRSEISPCSLASYLIRVRFGEVPPDFVAAWINSPYGRAWIASNKSQQVGQANLSGGTLKKMPVPVPPIAEAIEIQRRVSDALAAVNDTLSSLDAEAADAARLKQSILKAAFEGCIVPQDLTDEPAWSILARIASVAPSPARVKRGRIRRPAS